jgi:hypothetical protein
MTSFGSASCPYLLSSSTIRKRRNQERHLLTNIYGEEKPGSSGPQTDPSPAAPWDFDIFKRKIICFCAKNILHYRMFAAALNAGTLIHGDKTKKQECGLASFDSLGSTASPLPRTVAFVGYTSFLLNICHAIHSWVQEQDEADTESVNMPDFDSIFDDVVAATKSRKGGFFNVGNMHPESIPSAQHQRDGYNCGVYTCLTWTMFVAVKRDNPALWMKIETLADLDKMIVKPFWDLHENKEDRMINFRYRLCRLMDFILDKRLVVKKQRSKIAVGGHPLPHSWVYPKKLH